jgi:hypothetical protein
MELFSEDFSKLTSGIGMGIIFRSEEVPLTKELRNLVSPFETRCGDNPAFDISLLSEKEYPFGLYLYCHGHLSGDTMDHFQLSLARKPKKEAPPEFIEASRALGGIQNGMRQIFEALPKSQIEWQVSFDVGVINSALIPKKRSPRNKVDGLILNKEVLEYSLPPRDPESDAVEITVNFDVSAKTAFIETKSTMTFSLKEGVFDEISARIWKQIAPYLLKG